MAHCVLNNGLCQRSIYGFSLPLTREQNIIPPWDSGRHTAFEPFPLKSIPNFSFSIVTAPAVVHTFGILLEPAQHCQSLYLSGRALPPRKEAHYGTDALNSRINYNIARRF